MRAGLSDQEGPSQSPRKACLSDKCRQDRCAVSAVSAVSAEATAGHTDSPRHVVYGLALRMKH